MADYVTPEGVDYDNNPNINNGNSVTVEASLEPTSKPLSNPVQTVVPSTDETGSTTVVMGY